MNPYFILYVILATAVVVGVVQYITHSRVVRAVQTKSVHLKCSVCGFIVARFEQTSDCSIWCANCKRAAEKKRVRQHGTH